MLCKIDNSCFEQGSIDELICLFSNISLSSGLNRIFVRPKSLKTTTFQSLPPNLQGIIKQSLIANVNSSPYQGEVIDVCMNGHLETTKKIFDIQEAINYINLPVCVYVENIRNDGYFLNCIIKHFGSSRIKKALENNKIRAEHLGGCGSTKAVFSRREQDFKNKIKFFRYYVLWDSDKEFSDDTNPKFNRAICDLNGWKIKHHVLEKREAENYLPEDAIRELCGPNNDDWFNAFLHLTDEQKDFYDMQCGFKIAACDRNSMKEEIKKLYSTVSDTNWDCLSKGSGIANFKELSLKQFEESSYVHKQSLLKRMPQNPDELSNIAAELEKIL